MLSIRGSSGMNGANSKVYKAIIIGAGFSGMCASIVLANSFGGENIALVERNLRVGKKLILTGNGQCNVSNKKIENHRYHGVNCEFVASALVAYGYKELKDFFSELGVPLVTDGDKVYPMSKQASAVLDALRLRLEFLKVDLFTGEKVVKAQKSSGEDENHKGEFFTVKTEGGKTLTGKALIIATGGCVAPQTGSDGAGYVLSKSFGHSITPVYPSIGKLPCDKNKIKGLAGIKQQAELTVKTSGNKMFKARGDVLFAQDAISGNAAFNVSTHFSGENSGTAIVDFCPDITLEELSEYLIKKSQNCPYLTLSELFGGIINKKAAEVVIRNSIGINPLKVEDIDGIKKAAKAIKSFNVTLKPMIDFVGAQVTRGGVKTTEVNDKTMESQLVKGLYFVGEVLDVDGDCGGFNLQWAYSSAMFAAQSIIKAIK